MKRFKIYNRDLNKKEKYKLEMFKKYKLPLYNHLKKLIKGL